MIASIRCFVSSLSLAVIVLSGAAARAMSCAPEFSRPIVEALKRAQRLTPVEAEYARVERGWLIALTPTWFYALDPEVLADVPPRRLKPVTLVTKPSGHVLVVQDLGADVGLAEMVPTPGAQAVVMSGATADPAAWTMMLDESGLWVPRERSRSRAKRGFPNSVIPGARGLERVVARWTPQPSGQIDWAFTAPDGAPLTLADGEVIELRDGRRLARNAVGDIELRPAKGFSLALATEVKDLALKGYFKHARRALDDALTELPPTAELRRALPVLGYAHVGRVVAALVGPETGDERWVLLTDPKTLRFVRVPGAGEVPQIELANGWRVYARDGHWYTRGDGRTDPGRGPGDGGGGGGQPPPTLPPGWHLEVRLVRRH